MRKLACTAVWFVIASVGQATPANKVAFVKYYDRFLGKELNRCTTCHLPGSHKDPERLEDFPHNAYGDRLRRVGEELAATGQRKDVAARLKLVAAEDADGDGVENETELLAGGFPGDARHTAAPEQLAEVQQRRADFERFLTTYRWQPFERVVRPLIPFDPDSKWVRTPVDSFIAAAHLERGLRPRSTASKPVLLRRLYLDVIGLSPTPAEQRAFEEDSSPDAYEKVVDRLLEDPRHGERWARHWMDIWRYSDWAGWTDGKQVRDSQRHIWRWRDWIIESLNEDKGYDRMLSEMLAADELAPNDPKALRATGFLVRNYKMLSREQWLEDTVKHTAQAFLGVTLGCAKCHDHMTEPISQAEYYQVRAIFEPHQVRIDRVPGELDIEKDGLPRVYDSDKDSPTYFLIRGDERKPDKARVMRPAVPKALCADRLAPELAAAPVPLPRDAAMPDKRAFVVKAALAASAQALAKAEAGLAKVDASTTAEQCHELGLEAAAAAAGHAALLAVLRVEEWEDLGKKASEDWKSAAVEATKRQRTAALEEARLAFHKAKAGKAAAEKAGKDLAAATKKHTEAEQVLAKAEESAQAEPSTDYKPRVMATFPATSTGRRSAFAHWLASPDNPLTARVAVNHLWLRHMGRGLVATPENVSSGAAPSHPALLDWLAAEFMANGWKMKNIHRLILTSSTYRMASTPDEGNAQLDADNIYLWRMPSRRMEAELVRDNLLHAAGDLDATFGGPEIDHAQGLTSKRRSLYLRTAAEKEVEFLKLFDGPSVNECYQRRPSVMPQQALALANSELSLAQAKSLAQRLSAEVREDDQRFIRAAFSHVLARGPSAEELTACLAFLDSGEGAVGGVKKIVASPESRVGHRRESLVLVLFNHHDFVTIR